jgi:hypothetical protein
MLDSFPSIDSFTNQTELDTYLAQSTDFIAVTEKKSSTGSIVKEVNLKISPEFAAVVTTSGTIKVEGQVYNLLIESDAHQLEKYLDEAKKKSKSMFTIVDALVIWIPMWQGATTGDDYKVMDYRADIAGRSTVVQTWKGFCPTIALSGGVGAEIGLYQTPWWGGTVWWPDFCYPRSMWFKLVYNGTGASYIDIHDWIDYETELPYQSVYTWWLNCWRVWESAPSYNGNDYTLYYTIDGVLRAW